MSVDIEFLIANASAGDALALAAVSGDFSTLTAGEEARAELSLTALFRTREYAWFRYRNGLLDEATLNAYLAPLFATTQGFRLARWNEVSGQLDSEFVQHVNDNIGNFQQ